jgi:hypothetical protein
MKRQVCLLLSRFNCHKAHGWTLGRLADRLCIRPIVLLALDEGLYVSGRDQPDRVTEPVDLARPMMRPRAASGFHGHRDNSRLMQSLRTGLLKGGEFHQFHRIQSDGIGAAVHPGVETQRLGPDSR